MNLDAPDFRPDVRRTYLYHRVYSRARRGSGRDVGQWPDDRQFLAR